MVALYAALMVFLSSLALFVLLPDESLSGETGGIIFHYMAYVDSPMSRYIAMLTLPLSIVLSHVLNPLYLNISPLLTYFHKWSILHKISNILHPKDAVDDLLDKAAKSREFEKLALHALRNKMALHITLDTGKVYVGLVRDTLDPTQPREHIRIMPLFSGYRDSATQEVHFVTSYIEAIKGLSGNSNAAYVLATKPYDFEMVLSADRIVSAHIFDPDVYQALAQQNSNQPVAKR